MLVSLLLVQMTIVKNKAANVSCIVHQGYLQLFCIQHLISLGISFSLVWEWGQKCLKSNMMINANQLSSAMKPLGFNWPWKSLPVGSALWTLQWNTRMFQMQRVAVFCRLENKLFKHQVGSREQAEPLKSSQPEIRSRRAILAAGAHYGIICISSLSSVHPV